MVSEINQSTSTGRKLTKSGLKRCFNEAMAKNKDFVVVKIQATNGEDFGEFLESNIVRRPYFSKRLRLYDKNYNKKLKHKSLDIEIINFFHVNEQAKLRRLY